MRLMDALAQSVQEEEAYGSEDEAAEAEEEDDYDMYDQWDDDQDDDDEGDLVELASTASEEVSQPASGPDSSASATVGDLQSSRYSGGGRVCSQA